MSQTQLANIAAIAGIVTLALQKAGFLIPQENVVFIIGATWTIGWQIYSYWNRYQKGDLTLGGFKRV